MTTRCSALIVAAATASASGQSCQPYWRAGPPLPGPPGAGTFFAQFDDGSGSTVYVNRSPFLGVKRWRDHGWEDLPITGLPEPWVANIVVLNDGGGDALYYLIRLPQSNNFVGFRWNGAGWVQMPPAFVLPEAFPSWSAKVNGVHRIFAKRIVGSAQNGLRMWNGQDWELFAPMSSNNISGLFNYGDDLYVVGQFTSIAGLAANGIARYDGQQWHIVPGVHGVNEGGWSVVEYDDGTGPALYMTSIKFPPFGQFFPGVFKFDGQQFTPIGFTAPPPPSWITWVAHLAVLDDGRGPALYIAGAFPAFGDPANPVTCNGIVRWDGKTFESLGRGGTSSFVGMVEASFGRSILAGKDESNVHGGGTVNGSALWVLCPNCYANCDDSEIQPRLNIGDFTCFMQKFARLDPYANCNVDATIDIADFQCFLQKFAAGCP
jgi:hypothetical protein